MNQKSLLCIDKKQTFDIQQYIFQKIHNDDLSLKHKFYTIYNVSLTMFYIPSKVSNILFRFFNINFQLLWIGFLLQDSRLKLKNMTNL